MADEYTASAYVADDSPLTIRAPGADTAIPAVKASDVGALSVGDKVWVTVRNPRPPIIIGIEVEA